MLHMHYLLNESFYGEPFKRLPGKREDSGVKSCPSQVLSNFVPLRWVSGFPTFFLLLVSNLEKTNKAKPKTKHGIFLSNDASRVPPKRRMFFIKHPEDKKGKRNHLSETLLNPEEVQQMVQFTESNICFISYSRMAH